jgi:hypothetical protein
VLLYKKPSMRTFFLLLMMVNMLAAAGQSRTSISIKIFQEDNTPAEGITTLLIKEKDSSIVKSSVTDKEGMAYFPEVASGTYLVRATAVGYKKMISGPFSINNAQTEMQLEPIRLERSANELQGVVVSAKKPFIQRLNDRLIVNVESSIVGAGSSALDVLELSPGVTVDQNDAISLRGRAGVIIMIDGKPSPMTGAELANYLRGLPSNAIERIEIITNPSAKYDAAGNSGIIDIRMKKDQRQGMNGSFNTGYGQGVYPKANAGTQINYRNAKMNVFGSYNFSYRKNLNHLMINRNFFTNGVLMGADNKDNYATMPSRSHNTRMGADFFPSAKTIVGLVVNSSFFNFNRRADIRTSVLDKQLQPEFNFLSIGTNQDQHNNTVANINYKHRFDSTGKELSADVDYGVFNSRSLTRTASQFFENNGIPKSEDEILDGDQKGKLQLKTAKVDYTHPMRNGSRMEIGYKTSYVSSDNDAKFFNVLGTGTIVDDTKTNRFFYEEYNNAGYINLSTEIKKVSLQLGLRGEQTNVRTRQVKNDKRFRNDYFQFFPSAFFTYKFKPEQSVGISVSRRIDRPGYSQLNPFIFQVDATIYSTGEPLLKPQMTWATEMNYTLKNLVFTLNYSHTKDPQNLVLSRILDVIPDFEIRPGQDSNITVQKPVNLGSSDYFGFTATLPLRINKWWNMMNNINVFYNHFNGNIGGIGLNSGRAAANIRTTNNLNFSKGWSAELSATYYSGGRSGYMVIEPQWGIAAGVQKTIINGKGTLRFNVSDIFWTNLPRAQVVYEGSYIENWNAIRESRVANLSFTYRFGNGKVQAARRRTTASEEERQRAGGN